MAFSFSFAGDDIDTSNDKEMQQQQPLQPSITPVQAGAFPVAGRPQLPATRHDLSLMLAALPSKMAYSLLDVALDDGSVVQLPRRELWDVRVQLMAEEGEEGEEHDAENGVGTDASGLGGHDVKTGVYEGGFKSWESSVDLVKALAAQGKVSVADQLPLRIIELGCGTALPSLSLFQWTVEANTRLPGSSRQATSFIVADYNPTVLQLVTLPNFILAWALTAREHTPALREAFSIDGELELLPAVLASFQSHLIAHRISLTFLSGAWSPDFIPLIYADNKIQTNANTHADGDAIATLLLGAETIYSPFALQAFTETVFSILRREQAKQQQQQHMPPAAALVGAKRLYFGVGGSLDDFVDQARRRGGNVFNIREETDGVRRGVVKCVLQSQL